MLRPGTGNVWRTRSRMPALQYKSIPNSLLCMKHKLCAPWSPITGGHNKYLVNGAKKMSSDLNCFFLLRVVHRINERCFHAWGNAIRHAHGPRHMAGFAGSIPLHGKLMHACCQVNDRV